MLIKISDLKRQIFIPEDVLKNQVRNVKKKTQTAGPNKLNDGGYTCKIFINKL